MKRFLRQIGVQIGVFLEHFGVQIGAYVGMVLFGIPVAVFGGILFDIAGLPYRIGIVLGTIGVLGLRLLLLCVKHE